MYNDILYSREQKESELLSKVNQLAQEVRQKDEKIQRHEKTLQNIVSVICHICFILVPHQRWR